MTRCGKIIERNAGVYSAPTGYVLLRKALRHTQSQTSCAQTERGWEALLDYDSGQPAAHSVDTRSDLLQEGPAALVPATADAHIVDHAAEAQIEVVATSRGGER